jgi:hypothetical protein
LETTERIVEAYVRYVKSWATIANLRCEGQYEIDLLAIDLVTLKRYHIESGVSVSGAYSKLTAKPYSDDALKVRVKTAGQRRTIGYFIERKFGNLNVLRELEKHGFEEGTYAKVIVSWGWTHDAMHLAKRHGVELWDFRDLVKEIAETFRSKRTYFTDDTLRTLHLYDHATKAFGGGK